MKHDIPAFPFQHSSANGRASAEGMSLRDYFAAHAPAWVEGEPTWGDIQKFVGFDRPNRDINEWKPWMTKAYKAAKRYEWADAMLKARNSGSGDEEQR